MSDIFTPLLLEDIKRTADLCVKCNICTSACPVVPVTDLFPGPKFVGPQAQRFRDPGLPSPDHSLDYCSGCGVCTLVCPHGVKVMEINTAAKAELRTRQFRENPLNLRWWRNTAFGYNEVLGQMGGAVAPLANAVMGFQPVRMLMEKTLGIDHRAPFPTFHFKKFRGWFFARIASARQLEPARRSTCRRVKRPKSPISTAARPSTTKWKWAKRSSPCWSTTASRWCCRSRTAAACRCSPTATLPKPGATPRRISASWRHMPDKASPSSSAGRAAAWN